MKPFSIRIGDRIIEYTRPVVMGILNATPDSFFAASRAMDATTIEAHARKLIADGADIIDVGACSTRPGSISAGAEDELERLAVAIPAIRRAVGPDVPISVDTFRADVAQRAIADWGADIINDISGGQLDNEMFATVARLRVPYILMHTRGTAETMQSMTQYADVTADVIAELTHPLAQLEELGVADIIIDPGFGFAKTLEQNYALLSHLEMFSALGRPILAGMSRKSMATRLLDISADDAQTPTAILGALALERGAAILRVHDPLPAAQSIKIYETLIENS